MVSLEKGTIYFDKADVFNAKVGMRRLRDRGVDLPSEHPLCDAFETMGVSITDLSVPVPSIEALRLVCAEAGVYYTAQRDHLQAGVDHAQEHNEELVPRVFEPKIAALDERLAALTAIMTSTFEETD
jgi:hypothetical protein